jgi:hypothetical protein
MDYKIPEELYTNRHFVDILFKRYIHYKKLYFYEREKKERAMCDDNCIYKTSIINTNDSLRRYKSFYIKYYKNINELERVSYFDDIVDTHLNKTPYDIPPLPPLPDSDSDSDTD